MDQVLFIQTGGTIDKDYPQNTKGYAFEIGASAIIPILEKINSTFKYTIHSFCKKDSLDITDQEREELATYILNSAATNIIITHGSDTMIETANALNKLSTKKVIITGAMRPQMFTNSDAEFNVGMAIGALQFVDAGVYIAMHGIVKKASEINRNLETGQYY